MLIGGIDTGWKHGGYVVLNESGQVISAYPLSWDASLPPGELPAGFDLRRFNACQIIRIEQVASENFRRGAVGAYEAVRRNTERLERELWRLRVTVRWANHEEALRRCMGWNPKHHGSADSYLRRALLAGGYEVGPRRTLNSTHLRDAWLMAADELRVMHGAGSFTLAGGRLQMVGEEVAA